MQAFAAAVLILLDNDDTNVISNIYLCVSGLSSSVSFSLTLRCSATSVLSFNYREPPFLAFDPGIFSFSRCSPLNSISPFFNAPLSSIPAGNGREAGAAVFGGEVVVVLVVVVPSRLSENVDRRRESRGLQFSSEALRATLLSVSLSLSLSLSLLRHRRPSLITFIVLLVADTFARKSFPIDNRRLVTAVSQNARAKKRVSLSSSSLACAITFSRMSSWRH